MKEGKSYKSWFHEVACGLFEQGYTVMSEDIDVKDAQSSYLRGTTPKDYTDKLLKESEAHETH